MSQARDYQNVSSLKGLEPTGQDAATGANAGGAGEAGIPAISLPKGGGAIRGIGEKFAANPVTGTGSMTVPIAASPGRSGFGPQLSLSYDSGAGNGSFGFGWALSLPSITRKTEKGLPQYFDLRDSDVFILSGAEDLVPVYRQGAAGAWVRNAHGDLVMHEEEIDGYRVCRYRPRIEGLFARIERWTLVVDPGDVHWRSISKDNILTLYGSDADSRIFDPDDTSRVFSWLICETRDDKGNAVIYRYKEEDGTGVDLSNANERNRGPRNDNRRAVNRYLKRIYYGNRTPLLDDAGHRPRFLDKTEIDTQIDNADWMFEAVFDYGEHDTDAPMPNDAGAWTYRSDPFSSYRSGFEVRTTRLCRRVLMFHHFDGEEGVGNDCVVRSTDFTYSDEQDPIYTFLRAVTHTGYLRNNGGYLKRSLPPVEYEYTQAIVQDAVQELDAASLKNLPIGVDGAAYQWTDLHGEGIPGILTEQAGAWFYKRNISPISDRPVEFAPLERVAAKPNLALAGGHAQFMDLAGDGQPDLVVLDGPMPGLFEHDGNEGWQAFRPFMSCINRNMRDPNLKFVDLDGDGQADVLITEDDAFVWHSSLAEAGFGPTRRVAHALDEEKGPRLVFSDGTQSIYLADLSGDGLTDLVRIRNGKVCYWPNLGYGRFGAKVTMDHAPQFDNPDQFDHRRLRLADIDGTGTTDIIYLHREGVRLYFNQSGNSWSEPHKLNVFPRVDDLVSIVPTDLLGNGTACLVWSSPLPGDARRPMRFVNLMGGQKPHLLVKTINNLGAETVVHYAPSTKFYLQDKRDGKPWITRLPFPVHVVERVETHDHISRNRFVTRYVYHHGYFDGEEREFRGFGMVEQFDTEEFAALTGGGALPAAKNLDSTSHVPPVLTKTWFHTGIYLGGHHVSNFFAGLVDDQDKGEYYREPGLTDSQAMALLLPDTVLPSGLTLEEEREACRALKGAMLRQEVYALDGLPKEEHPYRVSEQNFSVQREQIRGGNRHAVFFTHAREAITYHYERNPADPRIQHALTLEVDAYGNVLKEAAIGYGRRTTIRVVDAQGQAQQVPNPGLNGLTAADQCKQTSLLAIYTENQVTNAIDTADSHRNPLPCEERTFELTGYLPTGPAGRFQPSDFVEPDPNTAGRLRHICFGEFAYEETATGDKRCRPFEWVRTLYRQDDLTALLPFRQLAPLGLPGESYKLAFTPGLLARVFQRPRDGQPPEALLPDPVAVLSGQAGDHGAYLQSQALKADGRFPNSDANDHWWIPSGRSFFSTNPADMAAAELAEAQQHFFLPRRHRDPFGQNAIVSFDTHDLLMVETHDALGNRVTVEANDYRVLQPRVVSDPNRNQSAVAFDALGMVGGTAVMGKPLPAAVEGDSLVGFAADLTQAQIDEFNDSADPHVTAHVLLQNASTRIVYDLDNFRRTRRANPADPSKWLPPSAATIARETHASDPLPLQGLKIQISLSYSDGLGREIQKKIPAEPGPVIDGGPVVAPRWVGSGWTIFNNKGKPARQYEPFFSATHRFEFGVQVGVSPILFYDPVERVVATLHPNHTWEKIDFDPWQQTTYDVNDTVLNADGTTDPKQDEGVKRFFSRLPDADYLPTWHEQRITLAANDPERIAAEKAAVHRQTPTVAYLDSLGRPFLTIAHNRFSQNNAIVEEKYPTRVELDIEGNQRAVRDAIEQAGDPQGRIVMRYDYDMLGNRVHQASMEAGERWMLNDVVGKPIRAWDNRGHAFRTEYDPLRRPLRSFVTGADLTNPNQVMLTERLIYGEQHVQGELRNLRGKLYLHLDQAGVVANEVHDFKGNLLRTSRRLTNGTQYRQSVDWHAVDADHVAFPTDAKAVLDPVALEAALAPRLENDIYMSRTTYDALNRPVQIIAPRSDQPGARRNVIQPVYNEANLLERVHVWLDHLTEPAGLINAAIVPPSPVGVTNIDYDAKGQRFRIDYKNGASTFYDYDPITFRLTHLTTTRPVGLNGLASQILSDPAIVQDLHYTYDPVGNITRIENAALKPIFHNNEQVEPVSEYNYDALYRLIEALGREHIGQTAFDFNPPNGNHRGYPFAGLSHFIAHPNDSQQVRNYTERYNYDGVGNFKLMRHLANGGSWARSYDYEEGSLIEAGKQSNRLTRTTVGNGINQIERYTHDAHGNMIRMPHLGGAHPDPNLHWDYRDQLRETDLGGGGTAYYVYDAVGQRVRKVWEKPAHLIEERIYLGGFEIYRRRQGAERFERETLHIMDDMQRIALVETRTFDTAGSDSTPQQLIRYQFGNHLGSASLELDHQAQIISYEEYTPYGSTSYQAVRSQTETPKRYRYTGKERDEESGLYYHGARYYAPWLAKWMSCDPDEIADSVNGYQFVRGNPVVYVDSDGHWTVDWSAVGRGATKAAVGIAIGVVVVVLVAATAGAAAPVIAAAVGASAATVAASGAVASATVYGAATAYGVYATGTTLGEVATGQEAWTGKEIHDSERSEKLGEAAVMLGSFGLAKGIKSLKAKASDVTPKSGATSPETAPKSAESPKVGKFKEWYNKGSEKDAEWAKLSPKEKVLHEIGQKTRATPPPENTSPIQRGKELVQEKGWIRALLPETANFMRPGEKGTLDTGPTALTRAVTQGVGKALPSAIAVREFIGTDPDTGVDLQIVIPHSVHKSSK